MTLFDDLWYLWKQYIGWFVVGNEHLKRIFFHIVLGCILTERKCFYIESASKHSTRLHTFVIQNSGTGKSQTMKATRDLLLKLKINATHTTKDNDAAAVGTVWKDKIHGKYHVKKGKMFDTIYYSWDEGSVLLKPSAYTDLMTDHFQRAMDEPGEVSKSLAMGTIEYKTNATLIAGSYMFTDFKKTLMSKGFLQRMLISYKEFSPIEEREIRIGVNLLKLLVNRKKIDRITDTFSVQTKKIPKGLSVRFNVDDVRKFNENLEKIYQEYIEHSFTGEKQRVLKTFFNRLHILIDKIATQRAVLMGRKEVIYEDMEYASDLLVTEKYTKNSHIKSIHSIFEAMSISSGKDVQQNRIIKILDKIRLTPILNQKQLLEYLKREYIAGRWDYGSNKSRTLIKSLIDKKTIASVKGAKNENLLRVL